MATEKIAILDFSSGKVFVYTISQREEASDFFARKGFNESEIEWMRGDLEIYIEKE